MKIGGKTIHDKRHLLPCRDLSHKDLVIAQFLCANPDDLISAVRFSCESKISRWDHDEKYRLEVLERVAQEIEENRASLISCAMKNVAKGISEVDAEVSEAIDFARYYSSALEYFRNHYPRVSQNKKGVILVILRGIFRLLFPQVVSLPHWSLAIESLSNLLPIHYWLPGKL